MKLSQLNSNENKKNEQKKRLKEKKERFYGIIKTLWKNTENLTLKSRILDANNVRTHRNSISIFWKFLYVKRGEAIKWIQSSKEKWIKRTNAKDIQIEYQRFFGWFVLLLSEY